MATVAAGGGPDCSPTARWRSARANRAPPPGGMAGEDTLAATPQRLASRVSAANGDRAPLDRPGGSIQRRTSSSSVSCAMAMRLSMLTCTASEPSKQYKTINKQ
eukprot:1179307-Prorocentrum_minimum.AAC.3